MTEQTASATYRDPKRPATPNIDVRLAVGSDSEPAIVFLDGDAERYWIPLRRCRSSAEVLDWICQIAGKAWADDATVGRMVRVIVEALDPQATLCSFGAERGPIDVDAVLHRVARERREDEAFAHAFRGGAA